MAFAKEPIASYSEYRNGYEFDENELFSYISVSEARKAISFMKRKKRIIYRGYVIRLMKTDSYILLRNYDYRYFVKPRSAESYPASFSYTSFEEAKSYVGQKYKMPKNTIKDIKLKKL